jgi:hypothetical protein
MWKIALQVILPDNHSSAYRRLLSLERKFVRDPAMAFRYEAVINAYVQLSYARELEASELPLKNQVVIGIPPLGGRTTIQDVVFDPSSRHDGICVNGALLKGPNLFGNLVNLLTTFRV